MTIQYSMAYSILIALMCSEAALADDQERSLCNQIAKAAFEENANLTTEAVSRRRSAPFLLRWTTTSGFEHLEDKRVKRFGLGKECVNSETGEIDACFQREQRDMGFNGEHVYETDPELYEEYFRWTDTVGFLTFEGRLLAVRASADYSPYRRGWSTGVFLKSIVDEESLVCAFDNRIHERRWGHKAVCDAVNNGETELLDHHKELPITAKDSLFDWPRDFSLHGYAEWDIDGDRKNERLLKITYSPGNGICPSTYYDLLSDHSLK